jgi:hypothetical protein
LAALFGAPRFSAALLTFAFSSFFRQVFFQVFSINCPGENTRHERRGTKVPHSKKAAASGLDTATEWLLIQLPSRN